MRRRKSKQFTRAFFGYTYSNGGNSDGSATLEDTISLSSTLGSKVMRIDKHPFRRKVMIVSNCLNLARAYHDIEDPKLANYYSELASEYFEEVLEILRK